MVLLVMIGEDIVRVMKVVWKLLVKKDVEEKYGELVRYGNIGCVYGMEFMLIYVFDFL